MEHGAIIVPANGSITSQIAQDTDVTIYIVMPHINVKRILHRLMEVICNGATFVSLSGSSVCILQGMSQNMEYTHFTV